MPRPFRSLNRAAVTTVRTGNKEVDAVLRDVADSVSDPGPLGGHIVIKDVALTASVTKTIRHNLGRKLTGWLVVRNNTAGVSFYDQQASNPTPEQTLLLVASGGNPTVTLLVF